MTPFIRIFIFKVHEKSLNCIGGVPWSYSRVRFLPVHVVYNFIDVTNGTTRKSLTQHILPKVSLHTLIVLCSLGHIN